MKKIVAWAMLSVTLIFAAFSGGFYFGMQQREPVFVTRLPPLEEGTLARAPIEELPEQELPEQELPEQELLFELNRVTVEELDLLPGIGPVIAERIVAYRTEIGGFDTVSELLGVSGIGEKKLEQLEPHFYLE